MHHFEDRMIAQFGCSREIVSRMVAFAEECVDAEQYADYIPAPKDEAVKKWLNQIYASLRLLQAEGGNDIVKKVFETAKEHCLYPEEIVGILQLSEYPATPSELIEKSLEGKLEIGRDFMEKANVKYVWSLDLCGADEYFKNYRQCLNQDLEAKAQNDAEMRL